tara:strand:- start:1686 stop:3434 length:1749 start_codon:yes stop_codon:yes gene_type:complete
MLIIRRIFKNISKERKINLFFLVILNFLNSFCEIFTLSLIFPYLSLLVDSNLENKFLNNFLNFFPQQNIEEKITLLFISSIVISLIFRLFYLWISGILAAKIGSELSIKAYNNYLYQPYRFHIEQKSGEIVASINLYAGQTIIVINSFLQIINSLIITGLTFISILIINPFITLMGVFSIISLYLIIFLLMNKKLFVVSQKSVSYSDQMFNSLQEGIGSIREIKINNAYEYFVYKYSKIVKKLRVLQANARFLTISPKFLIESIAIIVIVLIGFILFKKSSGNYSFIPTIGLIVFAIQRILPYLQQILNSWASLKTNYKALEKVINMIELPVIKFDKKNINLKYQFKKDIVFKNVSYRFNNESKDILRNINLVIEKGDKIGIVGETGSGKSTLLDLLMGLIKPTSGQILIDGIDINKENNNDFIITWRNSISAVSQTIFLKNTTIGQNIAFVRNQYETISKNKLIKVTKAACIYDFIKNSVDGFRTLVGERGNKLSGGQLQRIGIARALYKDSEIILLDESTSALDYKTEDKVIKSIYDYKKDITLVIIAHRVSTLNKCSKIIQINNGEIKKVTSSKDFFKN